MEKYLILIMGPQGSGKGTQGKLLAKKFGFVYAEMGPTLKEYGEENLSDGKIIQKMQTEGKLVPDKIVLRAIKYKFGGGMSIILDGVPRNKIQAKEIIALARDYGLTAIGIYIDLSDEEALARLLSRLICPVDGYEPPYPDSLKKKNCDLCQAKLVRRQDDNKTAIKERLKEYHQKTEPMIQFLSTNEVKIIKVDGRPNVQEVQNSITKELGEAGLKR